MEETCVGMDRRGKVGVLFNEISSCKTRIGEKNNIIHLLVVTSTSG